MVSCSGVNYGAIYLLPANCEKGIINQALLRIRLNTSIIDKHYFCYLWERILSKKITQSSGDSTIPNFPPLSTIKELTIDIPSLMEQKKLIDLPLCTDELIKINNKKIQVLTNKIKDIYAYLFLDNNAEIKFNDSNPFEKVSLTKNNLCTLIPSGINKFSGNKDYFSTSEVNGNYYQSSNKNITYNNRESRANMEPTAYSVWFAKMKKSIKHIWFGSNSYLQNKIILSTGFAGLKCLPFSYSYIWSIINANEWFEKTKDNIATGSTQEAISEKGLGYITIKCPNENCLKEYSKIITPLIEEISKLYEQNEQLTHLKYDLLSRLIS